MTTYSDLLKARLMRAFVGRQHPQNALLRRIRRPQAGEASILNIYGQTGMGKTYLLLRLGVLAEAEEIPAIGINVQQSNTPWLILQSLRHQITSINPGLAQTKKLRGAYGQLETIESRLLQEHSKTGSNLERSVEHKDSRGQQIGSILGEVAGAVTGLPFLSMLGSSVGGFLGTRNGQADFRRLARKVGLRDEEIVFYLGAEKYITELTRDAINAIADDSTSCVLTVDVYEQVTGSVDEWLRLQVLPYLQTSVTVVIAGRGSLYEQATWEDFRPILHQIELLPFTIEEMKEFWIFYDIADAVKVSFISDATGGHPFLNGLLADVFRSEGHRVDFADLAGLKNSPAIVSKVLARFMTELQDENFTHVLRVCAVPRWFDRGLLESILGAEVRGLFERIATLSFVLRNKDGSFSLHELARTTLLADTSAIDPEWVKNIHEKMAFLLAARREGSASPNSRYVGDEIYHRLSANEREGVALGQEMVAWIRSVGSRSLLQPIVSEMAHFDYETREGRLWQMVCQAQHAVWQGNWDLAEDRLQDLRMQPDLSPSLKGWATEMHATMLVGCGHYQQALELCEENIPRFTEQEPQSELSDVTDAYYRVIELCGILSKFSEAEAYVSTVVKIVGSDPPSKARILLAAATVHRLHGLTEQGIVAAGESVAIYRGIVDSRARAFSLIQLARLLTHKGRWIEAEQNLDEAASLEEQSPYEYDVANIRLFKGNIYRRRRSWRLALELYEQALQVHSRMGALREIGPLYGSMGLVHYAMKNKDLALRYLEDSVRLKRNQRYLRGVSISLKYLADVNLADNHIDLSVDQYGEALAYADELDILYVRGWARLGLMRARLKNKEFGLAQIELDEARPFCDQFLDLKSEMLLYTIFISMISSEGGVVDSGKMLEALRCGLEYNPYVIYGVVDEFFEDVAFTLGAGCTVRKVTAQLSEVIRLISSDPNFRTEEMWFRRQEGVPSDVDIITDRAKKFSDLRL